MKFFIVIAAFIFQSCAQLISVSQTSVPAKKGRIVETTKKKWVWGSAHFNNSFVYSVREDLIEQCPRGRVQGLLTTTEKIVYLPFLVERIKVQSQGFCNEM